ncbi:hypothetical protein K1T71_002168 [Dendrolimus kikuchii]|uniref:Uncharacterized protein n=1 Tax=Dendrolimus kikuchii TaxID=765133 RepID=A0ACC1DGA8_9NEOP|nr:hypothetical protein K1T71_002168 [Dendrolimus kikuchii]
MSVLSYYNKVSIANQPVPEQSPGDVQNLFNILPQPSKKQPEILEEEDEFLHKKETVSNVKPKAKITVPSLDDFKDVEHRTPNAKPRSINSKKSGLLSILPQPRNGVKATTKSLIPNILAQKSNSTISPKKVPLVAPLRKVDPKPLINDYSDESDTEDVQSDFFSINKPEPELPVDDTPLDIDSIDKESKKPFNIESYFKKDNGNNDVMMQPEDGNNVVIDYTREGNSNHNNINVESESGDIVLDEEAILKLCGSRGKRKREDIQIVDVNQQEVLADAREWLLKGLMDDTTKRVSSSKRKGNEPTTQQKRKHQITYLAHQAKANEAELQNQWASNRMSKRQTQSKYGF